MAKFPEPPGVEALVRIAPEIKILAAATSLWRIYNQGGGFPTQWYTFRYFGPLSSRFDHHPLPPSQHSEHGVYYCAEHGVTCVAEVFQNTRVIDRSARDPWLVQFRLVRDVPLLDLCGTWPTRAGASMNINSGPRPRARRWAQQIYHAYPELEGILYPSSMHANRPSVVFWERAQDAFPPNPVFHRALADPNLHIVLLNAARDLGYGLL